MANNNETSDRAAAYTDIQEQFLNLLRKYPVKNPETIVDYVSSQGETVLEDPEILAKALGECEIPPVRRRQVLKHWFAEKGIEVEADLLRRVALPPDIRKRTEEAEREDKAKYSVDTESGTIKVATTTDKTALTWDEAQNLSSTIKRELTEKRAEGRESPFIQDGEGNWSLNPKARVTGLEFMALEAIKKARERGEVVDPLEQLIQTAEKMRLYQEAFGGGARGMPKWMNDPAKFIEMVRTISGGGKEDEAVVREVAELRRTIDVMRDEKFLTMIAAQHQQIQASLEEIKKLGTKVEELGKPITGRTEMDIIHEVATAGIGLAQSELSGLRRDVREAMRSAALPMLKTPEQREDRKQVYRKSLARDLKIEQLGRSLFFGEGDTEVAVKKVPRRQASVEVYLYDPETKQIRTAGEGEVGGTMEQADEAERAAGVQGLTYE